MCEEHTSSYYAATRNDLTTYPRLDGDVETEICIIGGGFTGVASALTMAERGHQVVLLEQNLISWGASGRNGGQLIHGLGGTTGKVNDISNGYVNCHFLYPPRFAETLQQFCPFSLGYMSDKTNKGCCRRAILLGK